MKNIYLYHIWKIYKLIDSQKSNKHRRVEILFYFVFTNPMITYYYP